MTTQHLTDEQQEIVDLLRNELADIIDTGISQFGTTPEACERVSLEELAFRLEHIGNALNMAGMTGLASCAHHLKRNFDLIALQPLDATAEQCLVWNSWPEKMLGYLQYFSDIQKIAGAVHSLLNHLQSNMWPAPLSEEERATLTEEFAASHLDLPSDEDNLPATITQEMASLVIGEDIRKDLLDGMLQELPKQVSQFEHSVESYLKNKQTDALAPAQRMAHTVKGAANVVGVTGLANLMHYMEDLLETVVRKPAMMTHEFDDLLQDSADCLAITSEYLCGMGSAPDNIFDILCQLLDWVRKLKTDTVGATNASTDTATLPDQSHVDEQPASTPPQDAAEPEPITGSDLSTIIEQPETSDLVEPSEIEISFSDEDLALLEAEAPFNNEAEIAAINEELVPLNQDNKPSANAVTTETPSTADTAVSSTESKAEEASPEEDEAEQFHLSVPENTAQELLRLSGEMHINNTQVMAQLDTLISSAELADRYHKRIRTMSADLEALVQTQSALRAASMKYEDNEIDPLEMERYSELHTFSQQLLELATDSYEAIEHMEDQIKEVASLSYSQKIINQENQRQLLKLRLVPVSTMSSRFARCVRQASRLTGKAARLEIKGDDLLIDSRVLFSIADPIMHLLRNAVDHGLEESAQQRQANNKSSEGLIVLSFRSDGETIRIQCRDDGKGLDYKKIHATAARKSLIDASASLTEQQMANLVLLAGFSTRAEVSQTSGRGIGLDAVQEEVRKLKGTMSIVSTAGEGCCFNIDVPSSILTGHALLVRSHGRSQNVVYGLVTRSIQSVLYTSADDLIYRSGHYYFLLDEKEIPVYTLDELMGRSEQDIKLTSALIICAKTDGTHAAVAVQTLLASEDLVIKPLNKYSFHPEGVVGATILGDGSVAPVVDLLELPAMYLSQQEIEQQRLQRARIAALEAENYKAPLSALIVDDSLSARRTLAQFISDMGMEAYTAKDGFDAINVLKDRKPSIMLVDLEMPRMNGLELTAHLRSREDTRNIPVIMITSRTTEKHRTMAKNAGVDTYLNKPWSDEELLSTIQKEIA